LVTRRREEEKSVEKIDSVSLPVETKSFGNASSPLRELRGLAGVLFFPGLAESCHR